MPLKGARSVTIKEINAKSASRDGPCRLAGSARRGLRGAAAVEPTCRAFLWRHREAGASHAMRRLSAAPPQNVRQDGARGQPFWAQTPPCNERAWRVCEWCEGLRVGLRRAKAVAA